MNGHTGFRLVSNGFGLCQFCVVCCLLLSKYHTFLHSAQQALTFRSGLRGGTSARTTAKLQKDHLFA
jgi:hypothetical protein